MEPPHATELRVDPLSPDLSRELLQALVGSDPSLGPVKALLIDRTDGGRFVRRG